VQVTGERKEKNEDYYQSLITNHKVPPFFNSHVQECLKRISQNIRNEKLLRGGLDQWVSGSVSH
jgi:hypothetical protein